MLHSAKCRSGEYCQKPPASDRKNFKDTSSGHFLNMEMLGDVDSQRGYGTGDLDIKFSVL